MKIHPVQVSCSIQENGWTHMTKVIVVFRLKGEGGGYKTSLKFNKRLFAYTHTHTHTQRYAYIFFTGI